MFKVIKEILGTLFDAEKRKRLKNYKKGRKGELYIYRKLRDMGYKDAVLHDLILRDPTTGIMAQVDLVLATRTHVLIVEVKTQNFRRIEGNIHDDEWTVIYGNNSKYKSNNICKQVIKQKRTVESILRKNGVLAHVHAVVLVQNENKGVQICIEGLDDTDVHMVTSFDNVHWNSIDRTPNRKALAVLASENKKNAYVRKR